MVCPKCLHAETDVTNSRAQARKQQTWRRRKCQNCGFTFTTRESHDVSFVIVDKRDGSEEQFSRSKLLMSIYKACNHMADQQNTAEALADTVITKLMPFPDKKTSSADVAKIISEVLKRFDMAAAIKYDSFQTDLSNRTLLKRHLKEESA